MAYAQELRMIAAEADRREQAIGRLSFAYDVFKNYRDGAQPVTYADGTVAMDVEKATAQLEEAIRAVIGLPPLEA